MVLGIFVLDRLFIGYTKYLQDIYCFKAKNCAPHEETNPCTDPGQLESRHVPPKTGPPYALPCKTFLDFETLNPK